MGTFSRKKIKTKAESTTIKFRESTNLKDVDDITQPPFYLDHYDRASKSREIDARIRRFIDSLFPWMVRVINRLEK